MVVEVGFVVVVRGGITVVGCSCVVVFSSGSVVGLVAVSEGVGSGMVSEGGGVVSVVLRLLSIKTLSIITGSGAV